MNYIQNYFDIIIAALALAVSIFTICTNRNHYRLSVKPHLSSYDSEDQKNNTIIYKYVLLSDGIGPAKITSKILSYKNQTLAKDHHQIRDKIDELFNTEGVTRCLTSIPADNSLLAPSSELTLLTLEFTRDDEIANKINNILLELNITIKYESLYGDKEPDFDSEQFFQTIIK